MFFYHKNRCTSYAPVCYFHYLKIKNPPLGGLVEAKGLHTPQFAYKVLSGNI